MTKVWVLDTETKGTGANVVPYEKTLRSARREEGLALVDLGGPARPAPEPEPPAPLLFKVVNIMSSQVLAEGVGAGEAIRALERMRSVLDVRIFQWAAESGRWRLLTLDEAKALWAFRGLAGSAAPSGDS